MPSQNDLPSAYEYFLRERLAGSLEIATLVGNNEQSGQPNVYFQAADDGVGELCVIFDYATNSQNHAELPGDTVYADATFLVRIVGPRRRDADLRRGAALIKAVLHGKEGATPDGTVAWCEEESSVVQPEWWEDSVMQSARGGYYYLFVQPLVS